LKFHYCYRRTYMPIDAKRNELRISVNVTERFANT
jgi:hypothetical protein